MNYDELAIWFISTHEGNTDTRTFGRAYHALLLCEREQVPVPTQIGYSDDGAVTIHWGAPYSHRKARDLSFLPLDVKGPDGEPAGSTLLSLYEDSIGDFLILPVGMLLADAVEEQPTILAALKAFVA